MKTTCYRCNTIVTDAMKEDSDDSELLVFPDRIDDNEFVLCHSCSHKLDAWLANKLN